ncbi:MAG: GNAT family N-acetyltransferase [Brachybacterium sp.]|nr:GNAT family N-acetyltransferase [Brachybacterium sp.]
MVRREGELFPDEAWSAAQLAEEITHPARRYVVAAEKLPDGRRGGLLGYAGIMLAGDTADLHTIGAMVEGVGIGRALLTWCEAAAVTGGAGAMLLEVREDNTRARAFYERAGYAEVGRRRGYYRIAGRRVDAIVMRRDLP